MLSSAGPILTDSSSSFFLLKCELTECPCVHDQTMSPQLPLSTYSAEFRPPSRGRPARPQPSSAHRKNNPHPRPDFLLPRRLQTERGSRPLVRVKDPLVDSGPLFPPVRHISVQCPDGVVTHTKTKLSTAEVEAAEKGSLNSPRVCVLRRAGRINIPQAPDAALRQKQDLHSLRGSMGSAHRPGTMMTHQPIGNGLTSHHALGHRRHSGILRNTQGTQKNILPFRPQTRPQFAQINSRTDSSGGHSCFHVVKPHKAGFYIIHPEFVSEWIH
ncbi:uncharacterized protein LOC114787121 [Denticeps clupeoides]|uniref:uncharacterized protein LOC114787121 n=1 Tax=Denticeps clupeoides TaxID=299321 RepID=UPI0010A37F77|nr:uncharacterized protein LOC114787121 [Denticeps clupeoides]